METSELKTALLNGRAVINRAPGSGDTELEYKRVSAVIYRADGMGGIRVTAEIEDRNGRSVVIADPARIRYKEVKRE